MPVDPQTAVDRLGTTVYSSVYGGYTAPNNGAELDIYLTSLDPLVEAQFVAAAPATPMVFKLTPNTLETLNSMMEQLEQDWASIRAGGTNLVEFGPNVELGKLNIGVENLTTAKANEFGPMFGAGNVNVHSVSAADHVGDRLDSNRNNDNAPFYGGDAISDSGKSIGACTSGWGIKISGAPRVLTAGHCYPMDTNIINLKWNTDGTFTGSGTAMGSVTHRGLVHSLDSEVFTGCNGSGTCGGTGAIWTGVLGSPTVTSVSGVGSWAQGDSVCASGAYGGEICGFTVASDVNYCNTIAGYYFCHLTRATGNVANLPMPGDSGAPTYRKSGGYAQAVGTITGDNTINGNVWFTGINAELSEFGASLITVQ
jgi:hypothetical protein